MTTDGIRPHRRMTREEADERRRVLLHEEAYVTTDDEVQSLSDKRIRGIFDLPEEIPLRGDGHWRWLASTRDLQVRAYGDTNWPKEGEALADSVMMNATALTVELGEALAEVGWKTWVTPRGWVNRDAYLKELVDVGHFLANMLVAVGCTDDEWERLYQAKQDLNLRRQQVGYDGVEGKCHACHRALDDGGVTVRDNPRHPGVKQYVCAGCGAVQDPEVVSKLDTSGSESDLNP
jgi:hypothetical protein